MRVIGAESFGNVLKILRNLRIQIPSGQVFIDLPGDDLIVLYYEYTENGGRPLSIPL